MVQQGRPQIATKHGAGNKGFAFRITKATHTLREYFSAYCLFIKGFGLSVGKNLCVTSLFEYPLNLCS
jgi:hypothetical protein